MRQARRQHLFHTWPSLAHCRQEGPLKGASLVGGSGDQELGMAVETINVIRPATVALISYRRT
jgi:hypothetical protein